MPEFPDITIYIERLNARVLGQPLEGVRLASPFLVRTAVPPLSSTFGRKVAGFERIGKRIVFDMGDELFIVLHLMIAGRLRWRERGAALHKKLGLCAFDFPNGSVMFTEASSKKRASLHVIAGRAALRAIDPGGIDVMSSTVDEFCEALTHENHTIKRSLTDPRVLSGIGNAYSDEILHHAHMPPIRMTQKMTREEFERLHQSCKSVLQLWTDRLREELGPDAFPETVTAFHDQMAVHGRYGKPCPVCGSKVQRIAYADNETNYCARCQNDGKLLADRSLSRLLRDDWPRTLEELEERAQTRVPPAAISGKAPAPAAVSDEPKARVSAAKTRAKRPLRGEAPQASEQPPAQAKRARPRKS
jgi:formamidopyrimidine-DNA glycosylase